jgi:hypothetical protein
MSAKLKVLEHEILKALYVHGILTIRAHGSETSGHRPIFKKVYEHATFNFGTLVDILNNPDSYKPENYPAGHIMYLRGLNKTVEEVIIGEYEWGEVADAVELLAINKHIKDDTIGGGFLDAENRQVSLTHEGGLAYRSKYYIKEAQAELSLERQYEIQRMELWQKKYWVGVEIAKYVVGGVIGALIALALTPSNKSAELKEENKQIVPTGARTNQPTLSPVKN